MELLSKLNTEKYNALKWDRLISINVEGMNFKFTGLPVFKIMFEGFLDRSKGELLPWNFGL
jgi:hypothetical protein